MRRAQALLGIVKSAKRGTGKTAMANAAKSTSTGGRFDPSSKSRRIRALLATGMTAAEIAKKVGCSTPLVYMIKSSIGLTGTRGPRRPRDAAPSMDGLENILAHVKNSERERSQMRGALERIQSVIAGALG